MCRKEKYVVVCGTGGVLNIFRSIFIAHQNRLHLDIGLILIWYKIRMCIASSALLEPARVDIYVFDEGLNDEG